MSEIVNVRLKRFEEIQQLFRQLIAKAKDMTHVWQEFIPFYQQRVIGYNWRLKGALMGTGRGTGYSAWVGLNAGYRAWKSAAMSKLFAGQGEGASANLILNGKLKRAATGSVADGWTQSITPQKLTMGIQGDAAEYGELHQTGATLPMTKEMRKGLYIKMGQLKKWTNKNNPGIGLLKEITKQSSVRIPQRAFFYSVDGGIPGVAEQKLVDLMRKHIVGD